MTKAQFMPPMYAPASPEEINRAQREGRPEPRSADQAHHDDNLNYERYVDGLRKANSQMRIVLQALVTRVRDLISTTAPSLSETAALSETIRVAEILLMDRPLTPPQKAKSVTVHVEGGLVQDVTGIPAGYEVRVEDYDVHDPDDEPKAV